MLTRGPVHEAFAETVTLDPQPGIVVPKAAPNPIEEVPPEQRPAGVNVTWVPGYWAWDDERGDFLWISGIWRALPPGRQWVPGYWSKAGQGYQWTSGYWAGAKVTQVEYLPEPPGTVEVGPNINAPSADYSWLPGCWVWHGGRYAWRPGYWAAMQQDWVWIPCHYVWAPRGYVLVDGYWDYAIGRRGVLFAPVHFDRGVHARRGFRYSPVMVIDLNLFTDHLFLRPNYHHYYFGDYYAPSYYAAGFYPWFSLHTRRYGYDPIYAHQRWTHRNDREWERRLQSGFQHRRQHEDARPPRTLAAQRAPIASSVRPKGRPIVVATPLAQLAKRKDIPARFQPVGKEERRQIGQRGQEVRRSRDERRASETKAVDTPRGMPSRESGPVRARLPRSPIAAESAERPAEGQAPPRRYEAPKPNPDVEPRPRTPEGRPDRPGRRGK